MPYPASVSVFCGASRFVAPHYFDLGTQLGRALASHHIRLIYGGGDCGVMGAVANGALSAGGKVTGVFPQSLKHIENEHQRLTETVLVETMHQRKEIMYQRSEAFIILPGGFGTLDEMFEILTWKQLKLHSKPIIIFNHQGYWDHLVALMQNILNESFASPENAGYYQVATHVPAVLELLAAH